MRQPTSDKWVRAKRTQAHLTQEQLAKETGLTLRDIQRIEHGDLHMSYKKYLAVALYFDATMDEMLYGEVEEE
ncbi:MAG: helix-turn-helix transcriptional regulator [Oscillospiraceae bacterium]